METDFEVLFRDAISDHEWMNDNQDGDAANVLPEEIYIDFIKLNQKETIKCEKFNCGSSKPLHTNA